MRYRQQNSTTYPIPFFMADDIDHISGETGLVPTVTICKSGALAFGAAAGAVTEAGNGWYWLAGNAADRDTLGELLIHASAANADPTDISCMIVNYNPFAPTSFPAGAIEYTYTVTSSLTGLPIDGVEVWFSTDLAHTNIIWKGETDAFGVARDVLGHLPWLDAGVYYVWKQLGGYTDDQNPDVETVP